jgi:hypothetical protein
MSDAPRHEKQKGVLSDHKRVGKRFIPPFVHALDALREVKWIDVLLPELLWLALLNHQHGLMRGAELAVAVARVGVTTILPAKKVWFGPISAFEKMGEQQQQSAIAAFRDQGHLENLRLALRSLVALYPECPLAFVFEGEVPRGERSDHLSQLKAVLADLFDKTGKAATLMQANAVYIAFATDMLFVSSSTSLAKFPAVASYPDTEEAKQVGAAARTAVMAFLGSSYDASSPWPRYFWNRGLEVDSCSFGTDANYE